MKNTKVLVLLIALALAVSACGDSAEEQVLEQILESGDSGISDVDIDSDSGDINISFEDEDGQDVSISASGDEDDFSMVIEGEDGEVMTFGTGELPEGLQIPVAPGGEVQSSISGGSEILVILQYADTEYEELVAYYEDQLDSASEDVEKSETSFTTEDGTFRTAYFTPSSGSDWTVSVGDCIGTPGICVTIAQSE